MLELGGKGQLLLEVRHQSSPDLLHWDVCDAFPVRRYKGYSRLTTPGRAGLRSDLRLVV